MLVLNTTNFQPSTFLLVGIPGLEAEHYWISLPFCSAYIIALMGNFTLLFIIKVEESLHEPMYIFLSMLSSTDLVLSTSIIPKILAIFWFNSREIDFHSCLTQMFFIHSFAAIESGFLLAMAFDRYVAICNPLRYTSILTNPVIINIGLSVVVRAVSLVAPLPFLARRFPYCGSNIVHHSYCEHMAVVKLACADTTFSNLYGIIVALFLVGLDLIFIAFSYILILRAVFRLASDEARLKALSTCASHICAILVFYVPVVLSSVVHRFGQKVAPHVHILLASSYLLIPPMINPIIYGIKTKQICERVLNLFRWSCK
ncbi:olfactory receptor 52K1-like [Rhinatrema bivittatum]|uniref:olfactory receptor 52K1-like n=1 Tax=Rhinatrema bivittatum TaxID=194408 RepID=UPI00112BB950|nr:olfactory receptor 52K1-like [Rhinatrema bivittatum]